MTPVLKGKPIKFVAVPDAGVPSTGDVRVGAVHVLFVKVSIPVRLTFKLSAVCVAVLMGFNKSVVLSIFAKPTIAFVMPETEPVNVGDAIGAFRFKSVMSALSARSVELAFRLRAVIVAFRSSAV